MFSYSLNSLIVFFEVIKLNSFSKAADLLFMTQPGVSNHVSQLEAQTGSRLVKRENGTLKLTKEGRVVYRHAEKIEGVARGLENAIRTMKEDTPPLLKVATTSVYSRVMVPFILGTFQEDNPDVMIALDVGNSADLIKSIVSMKNDVVIVANQKTSKSLAAFPLVKEDLVVIVPNSHPFSGRPFISLKDIEGQSLIIREEGSSTRNMVLGALEAMKTKPSNLIDMRSTEFIKEWVSQGKGISILIKRAVLPDDARYLKAIPLKEKLTLDVSVLFLKSRKFDLSIRRFLHHVEELKARQVI